jgi:hypothetical protein
MIKMVGKIFDGTGGEAAKRHYRGIFSHASLPFQRSTQAKTGRRHRSVSLRPHFVNRGKFMANNAIRRLSVIGRLMPNSHTFRHQALMASFF